MEIKLELSHLVIWCSVLLCTPNCNEWCASPLATVADSVNTMEETPKFPVGIPKVSIH